MQFDTFFLYSRIELHYGILPFLVNVALYARISLLSHLTGVFSQISQRHQKTLVTWMTTTSHHVTQTRQNQNVQSMNMITECLPRQLSVRYVSRL